MPDMDELLSLSHLYGRDPEFVIAGGGNTSMKTADRLWVKASGTSLAKIAPAGFVEMDRAKLQAILESTDWPDETAAREAEFQRRINDARAHSELNQRPSVEVLLHHLLPQRLVVHTHATRVNAVTCCIEGRRLADQTLGQFVWQPYVDPGLVLARSLAKSARLFHEQHGRPPAVVLLQNHGLIVTGENAQEIEQTTDAVIAAMPALPAPVLEFETPDSPNALEDWDAVVFKTVSGSIVCDRSDEIRWLVGTPQGRTVAISGPMTPDQIVYARSFPLWIDGPPSADRLRSVWSDYVSRHGFEPWVILIADVGMIVVRSSPKVTGATRAVYRDAAKIYRAAHELGGVSVLSERDRKFIENWEVEAYRRSVAG